MKRIVYWLYWGTALFVLVAGSFAYYDLFNVYGETVSHQHTELELVMRSIYGAINLFLCIFNLLPIPGLDGWNILTNYQPRLYRISSEFMKGMTVFLIFLLLFSTKYIFLVAIKLMDLAPDLLSAG